MIESTEQKIKTEINTKKKIITTMKQATQIYI